MIVVSGDVAAYLRHQIALETKRRKRRVLVRHGKRPKGEELRTHGGPEVETCHVVATMPPASSLCRTGVRHMYVALIKKESGRRDGRKYRYRV